MQAGSVKVKQAVKRAATRPRKVENEGITSAATQAGKKVKRISKGMKVGSLEECHTSLLTDDSDHKT
jgi:hypothetical protein